jgi:hypothetical protein
MKMSGHSTKYFLAYYLADQLDAARKYSKEEIEQFIASQVDPTTYDDPTMALDHIRMAMVDNQFLIRNSDGGQYWVSELFVKPVDLVKNNFEKLTRRQPSVGGEIFTFAGTVTTIQRDWASATFRSPSHVLKTDGKNQEISD